MKKIKKKSIRSKPWDINIVMFNSNIVNVDFSSRAHSSSKGN